MDRVRFYFLVVCCCLSLAVPSSVVQAVLSETQAKQIQLFIEQLRMPETEAGAVGGLVAVGAPAVPALMEMALRGPNPFPLFPDIPADPDLAPRRAAWKTLISIGEPAVPHLIEAFENEDLVFASNASWVLRDIGEPTKSYLINAMKHKNAQVRKRVVGLLARFGDATLLEVLKAQHDVDAEVRANVIVSFLGYDGESPHLVKDTLMEFFDYEDPRFSPEAGLVLFSMMPDQRVRLSLLPALRSPDWGVRFGIAIAYAYAWGEAYHPRSGYCVGPLPTEVVPTLIEGLNRGIERGDMWLRERAVWALWQIEAAEQHAQQTLDNAQKAKKAIEAFPPMRLLRSTVKDGDTAVDVTSLNREGIRFDFSNSVYSGDIRIRKLNGELLAWEEQQNTAVRPGQKSDWITITPMPGNELVGGTVYIIEIQDIKDFLGNLLKTQIRFTTKE